MRLELEVELWEKVSSTLKFNWRLSWKTQRKNQLWETGEGYSRGQELSVCLPACLPAVCLPACLSACLPACLPLFSLIYLTSQTQTQSQNHSIRLRTYITKGSFDILYYQLLSVSLSLSDWGFCSLTDWHWNDWQFMIDNESYFIFQIGQQPLARWSMAICRSPARLKTTLCISCLLLTAGKPCQWLQDVSFHLPELYTCAIRFTHLVVIV